MKPNSKWILAASVLVVLTLTAAQLEPAAFGMAQAIPQNQAPAAAPPAPQTNRPANAPAAAPSKGKTRKWILIVATAGASVAAAILVRESRRSPTSVAGSPSIAVGSPSIGQPQ